MNRGPKPEAAPRKRRDNNAFLRVIDRGWPGTADLCRFAFSTTTFSAAPAGTTTGAGFSGQPPARRIAALSNLFKDPELLIGLRI